MRVARMKIPWCDTKWSWEMHKHMKWKKIQSDHDEKFMHMKWKIYNGNTFLKINQNSKNSMLTFDCFTTREIMREREGIEKGNMKIIDRFSYSDGGTKVKSYFSEE